MFYSRRHFHALPLGLTLAACLAPPASAAPPDRDYEAIVPAPRSITALPTASPNPPGLAASPLAIADRPTGSYPQVRFVMRDGSVLVGQVLGFDGRMYALRLPHSTLLVRKDLFTAVAPAAIGATKKATARPVRAGARY